MPTTSVPANPDPLANPISFNTNADVGGSPTLISYVLFSTLTIISTGTFIPLNEEVAELISATTLPKFNPNGPKAGAIDPPGFASPASTKSDTVSNCSLILLYLYHYKYA